MAWHRRFHRESWEENRDLTLEERGAFVTLTDVIYDTGGFLPDDDRLVAGYLGATVRVWRRLRARFVELGRLRVEDGLLHTPETDRGLAARQPIPGPRLASDLPSDWGAIRARVIERDGERCSYCGSITGPFEVDHVVPRARGGGNEPENLAVACRLCNRSKKDRTIEEWIGRALS